MTVGGGDDFNIEKLGWLGQVLRDHSLPRIALHVAVALSGYVNRGTRDAWPSQATLAKECSLSRNGLRKGLKALEAGAHLVIIPGQGLGNPSRYTWRIKGHGSDPLHIEKGPQQLPYSICERATAVRGKGHSGVHERATAVATNLMIEPSEEPIEGDISPPSDLFGQEEGQRRVKSKASPRQPKLDLAGPFEEFWLQYPRKAGKNAARAAYERVVRKQEARAEELLAGAIRYAAEREGQEVRFTKFPATWLNAGCWTDEPAPTRSNSSRVRHDRPMSATEQNLRRIYERQHTNPGDFE